jgi:hypothetical protein
MDYPGQGLLFDLPEAGIAPRVEIDAEQADAIGVLADGLPRKATVNRREAAMIMGVCASTVENWINDGTLLCQYANRSEEAQRRHARVVVRAARPYDPQRKKWLTLAELVVRRSNVCVG